MRRINAERSKRALKAWETRRRNMVRYAEFPGLAIQKLRDKAWRGNERLH
jgi:hypothetical protein